MKKFSFNNTQALCIVAITMIAVLTNTVFAQENAPLSSNKKIRFYKVNKDMQSDKIKLTSKKFSQLGCNNFIKQVRVHRAVQTGFVACSLYTDKDCPLARVVPVAREEVPRRTYLLSEGFGWLPQSDEERGVKIKSWKCDIDLEADLLGRDSQLAKLEVARLEERAQRAKRIAQRIQKKANKADKDSKEAVELAATALKRAVDAGYKPPPELDKRISGNDFDNMEDTGAKKAANADSADE